jgi:hypothetical protein
VLRRPSTEDWGRSERLFAANSDIAAISGIAVISGIRELQHRHGS